MQYASVLAAIVALVGCICLRTDRRPRELQGPEIQLVSCPTEAAPEVHVEGGFEPEVTSMSELSLKAASVKGAAPVLESQASLLEADDRDDGQRRHRGRHSAGIEDFWVLEEAEYVPATFASSSDTNAILAGEGASSASAAPRLTEEGRRHGHQEQRGEQPSGASETSRRQLEQVRSGPVGDQWSIYTILEGFAVTKSPQRYIREDCRLAFDEVSTSLSGCLDEVVQMAQRRAEASQSKAPGGRADFAFALAAYTVNVDAADNCAEETCNFYDALNKVLQTRRPELVIYCLGYLSYLLRALRDLPLVPEKTFHRGLPWDKLDVFRQNYILGRRIVWSGITSLSEKQSVAKRFAQKGGVVMHVTCSTARSIRAFSAFPQEAEVVLLPNWTGFVTKDLEFCQSDNVWYMSLREIGNDFYRY